MVKNESFSSERDLSENKSTQTVNYNRSTKCLQGKPSN